MSIHYLIDPYTVSGDIIDVATATNGQTDSTGSTVVRIPDGVAIQSNPVDRATLLTEKYDGLLATYPGFTNIVADPCLDVLTFDTAQSFKVSLSSGLVNHCFLGLGSIATSAAVSLISTPTVCVLVWEEYSFQVSDDKTGRYQHTYVEGSGSDLDCIVSFDNGLNTNPINNGEVLNIPVSDQGSDFILAFGNTSSNRVYLGSWALIF
jgi:hypothetical protein